MFTFFETSSSELQLSMLEVLYITKYQPALCKQKEFYNLLLFNPTDYIATKPDLIQEKTLLTPKQTFKKDINTFFCTKGYPCNLQLNQKLYQKSFMCNMLLYKK